MKQDRRKVISNLKKLHKKMISDMVEWSKLYDGSGAIEFLKSHDEEFFSVHEIITGRCDADDIGYQIKYIEEFVKNGDKENATEND